MEKKISSFSNRSVAVVLGCIFAFSGMATPRPAHAILGVADVSFDPAVWFEDLTSAFFAGEDSLLNFVLKPLAWAAAKAAINSLTQSTVNWINNGFEGSPAYETDLRRSMSQLQDSVASDFFKSLQANTGIDADAPFKEQVSSYLRTSFYKSTNSKSFWSTNLSKTTKDPKSFRDGKLTGNGGWDGWFSTVLNEQNNTYGAVFYQQDKLNKAIENFRVTRLNELQWGKGFLSWKGNCIKTANGTSTTTSLNQTDKCLQYETKTPGTVIESQLEHNLGSGIRQLELADDIDEIVSALMTQLIKKVMSDEGLSSVSKPRSGGGSSFVDSAADEDGTGGLGTTLLAAIDGTTAKNVQTYKSNWTKIQDVAREAQASCATNNQDKQQEISKVISDGDTAIKKADAALAEIARVRKMVVDAMAATTNKTQLLSAASDEYRKITGPNSTILPTIREIGQAEFDAKDIDIDGDGAPLYSKMKGYRDECRKK